MDTFVVHTVDGHRYRLDTENIGRSLDMARSRELLVVYHEPSRIVVYLPWHNVAAVLKLDDDQPT